MRKLTFGFIGIGLIGPNIRLYVDDDDPGVPREVLPKLFDVFYLNQQLLYITDVNHPEH